MNDDPVPDMTDRQRFWRSDAMEHATELDALANRPVAGWLARFYRIQRLRGLVRWLCLRLEGGPIHSVTWRQILKDHHGVTVGRYSYGDVLKPGLLPPGTVVGAYCSTGTELIVRRRNHPMERPLLHPFFYNSRLGLLNADTIPADRDNPLTIGHDVWIADRVIILAGCRSIGNGAVIAAGAVVTRDVAPYSIVAGTPARLLRMRFGPERVAAIETSQWWTKGIADLIRNPPFADMLGSAAHHPTDEPTTMTPE